MDPLSVAASVAGLLSVGGKLSGSLLSLITKCRDVPHLLQSLFQEITDTSAAICRLQIYVAGSCKVATSRASMILLQHIVTALTGCVTTFSDLQRIMNDLNMDPEMGIFDQLKWVRYEKSIKSVVQRLQNQKLSLTLMLNIIQWYVNAS
jgi:hypothetical protein